MGRRRRSLLGGRGSSVGGDDEPVTLDEEPLTDPGAGIAASLEEARTAHLPAPEDDLLSLAPSAPPPDDDGLDAPPIPQAPIPPEEPPEPSWATRVFDPDSVPPAKAAEPPPAPAPLDERETARTVRMERPDDLVRPPREAEAWSPEWSPEREEVIGAAPIAPAQPSFQALDDARPTRGDAPVPRDLFGEGGFDELEDIPPPTEEMPAGVMEDVGQTYSTPYSVPEPPPIPGIVDRFTPPPTARTELGGRKRKPDYIDDTPEGAPRYEPTAAPAKRKSSGRSQEPVDDHAVGGGPPFVLLAGLAAVGLLGVGLIAVAVVLLFSGGTQDTGLRPERDVRSRGVEVRQDVHRAPEVIGSTPDPAPIAEPVPLPPEPGTPVPGTVEAPAPTPPGPTAPTPTPAPTTPKPVSPAPTTPKPAPTAPTPAPVTQAQGVLKIRANRRAIVYVNDQAIGFTPLDHKVGPGTYTVAAMLPQQPTSRQEKAATVSGTGAVPIDFQF